MEDHITVVLGNHDLHLIGRAYKLRREKPLDSLDDVLGARDRFELINWLRRRPLLHRQGRFVMVHAGLHPKWTPGLARSLAREAEAVLRGPDVEDAILAMRKKAPRWRPELPRKARLRVIIQTLTGLRACSKSGRVCNGFSGRPEDAPDGFRPWFEIPTRRSRGVTVVCGHWAALGLRVQRGLIALDTGCVWGRSLTAVRLKDRAVFQEPMVD
jgi:bis(5'-nucleosyl)-tetraphosphatase (symmetrical)